MSDPIKTAKLAGLKYVTDQEPGILRKRKGKSFLYKLEKSGKKPAGKIIERIKALVIPPAWEEVWICRWDNGHLQVTGRDQRKRKQYRYHDKWTVERNGDKFSRMPLLGTKIPILRKRIKSYLAQEGLPKDKVLAAIVRTMLVSCVRVGNASYALENDSYGITTILNRHAKVKGSKVNLNFKGKSGVAHQIEFNDPRVARIIQKCQELPGQELFCYQDSEGNTSDITSSDVNQYLRDTTGEDFTAKDLRTWLGSCKAMETLLETRPEKDMSSTAWKRRHNEAIKNTATQLRNTVAVCRKYYVHPVVFEADQKFLLLKLQDKFKRPAGEMSRGERILMTLFRRR